MLWLQPAFATPKFVADEPGLSEMATLAWNDAIACTGREARAYPAVVVDVTDVPDGFSGMAHRVGPTTQLQIHGGGRVDRETIDEGGMYMIRLQRFEARTLAHEVAHAWVHGGPPALVEGATDLLADCIAEKDPTTFPAAARRPSGFPDLSDLRSWSNPHVGASGRGDGYAAAYQLMSEVALVAGRELLWRDDWTWPALDAVLEGLGASGTAIRSALAGGVETQRGFLGDLDEDGLTGAEEIRRGSDPALPDTDGDGWWDGVPAATKVGRVRVMDHAVCTGQAAGPGGAAVEVDAIDGRGRPAIVKLRANGLKLKDRGKIAAGASLSLVANGLVWARVSGTGLQPDERCWSGEGWDVFVEPSYQDDLVPFSAALLAIDTLAATRFGPGAGASVHLGEPTQVVILDLQVNGGQVEWAREHGWEYVAALVVARARLSEPEPPVAGADTSAMEALARSLVPKPPDVLMLAIDDEEVAAWERKAEACGGWRGVLTGTCGG